MIAKSCPDVYAYSSHFYPKLIKGYGGVRQWAKVNIV